MITERPRAVRRPIAELAHNAIVGRLRAATRYAPDYRHDLRTIVAPIVADPAAGLEWSWWLSHGTRGREVERSLAVAAYWPWPDEDGTRGRPLAVWPVRVLADPVGELTRTLLLPLPPVNPGRAGGAL